MSEAVRDLFDRWERVWHEGQYDLIPSCVGSHYIRHDEKGDRTVTREAYAAELAAIHKERSGTRVVVYDHSFTDDRAWFRFSFVWPDPATGERRSRAGMQSYRIEGGKLAETCDYATSTSHRMDGCDCPRALDGQASRLIRTCQYTIPLAMRFFTDRPNPSSARTTAGSAS